MFLWVTTRLKFLQYKFQDESAGQMGKPESKRGSLVRQEVRSRRKKRVGERASRLRKQETAAKWRTDLLVVLSCNLRDASKCANANVRMRNLELCGIGAQVRLACV